MQNIHVMYILLCLLWAQSFLFHTMPLPVHFGDQGWPIPKRGAQGFHNTGPPTTANHKRNHNSWPTWWTCEADRNHGVVLPASAKSLGFCLHQNYHIHQIREWNTEFAPPFPHETCDSLVAAGPWIAPAAVRAEVATSGALLCMVEALEMITTTLWYS